MSHSLNSLKGENTAEYTRKNYRVVEGDTRSLD